MRGETDINPNDFMIDKIIAMKKQQVEEDVIKELEKAK